MSEKGSRKLTRKPYERHSDRTAKKGISNDKVSLPVATDRKGNPAMQADRVERIDVKSMERTISENIRAGKMFSARIHILLSLPGMSNAGSLCNSGCLGIAETLFQELGFGGFHDYIFCSNLFFSCFHILTDLFNNLVNTANIWYALCNDKTFLGFFFLKVV
ncbi:hypothetical protein EZS27_043605, partial [termite gut metagenome]